MKITLKELKELVGEIIAESSDATYKTYHRSYTSAVNEALDYAEKRGYEYDQEETAKKIGMGRPKPRLGDTNRISISLYKNGKLQNVELNMQIFRQSENTFELNVYIS